MIAGQTTFKVKFWLASGGMPLLAPNVIGKLPIWIAVPPRTPVPGVKVTPVGSVPARDNVGVGKPVVVTVLADRDLEGVRVEVPAVGGLRGKVRDTAGRGVARASIEVNGVQSRQGTTADDGSFRVENIGAGSYRVLVRRGSALLRPPGKGDDAVQGEPVEIVAEAVATADAVTRGERQHRAAVTNPRTEAGRLAHAFNLMLDQRDATE